MSEGTVIDHEAESDDITGEGATEEATRRYVRSPEDVLRLVVFGVVGLLLAILTLAVERSIIGFEEDVLELFDFLTPAVVRVVDGVSAVVAGLIFLGLYALAVVLKRYRLLGYLVVGSIGALALMTLLDNAVDRQTSEVLVNELADRAGLTDAGTATVSGIAQLSAIFVIVRPFVSRRWRNAGVVVMALLVLTQLIVATRLPVDLFLALPVGAAVGTGVLLAFGRPDRRPTLAAILASLRGAALAVVSIRQAAVDARGSTPYFAVLDDGSALFVKVLGAQERAADLLFRIYRFLRLKDVGDDRPFSSLRRTVEHEALIALMARDVGIRTPRLRSVVDVGADSMLLAYDMIDGRSLDGVPDEDVTDDMLRAIWGEVGVLRRQRIAHRDLRRANIFVADDGDPWMIDFGFSEVAVSDHVLDADVAQLLASMAVAVGAERAVSTAVEVLGGEIVGASLPRMQMKALSGATQSSLKEHHGLLDELHTETIEQCGVEQVQYAQLDRINRKLVLVTVVLALATYFLFPQLADLPGIFREIESANWAWAPLLLLGSAMTYVAASISLAGAVPQRLAAGPLLTASVGSSFATKLAPAGVGGMALNVRFLQKQGVDEAVAVSGIGLNTVAGVAGHMSLVGVFIVWAGQDAFGSFELPDPKWFIVGVGVVAVLLVISLAIRQVRSLLITRLLPVLRRSLDGVTDVLRRPGKLVMLVGGSTLVTFSYLTTLYFATQAFGGGLAFAAVGAVFLVGSAVAQAAPTPGGLGAVEAALIGGLVAAGLDDTVAVPAVFLYRLFTFWVPILPGWLCFQWLEHNDYV